ncbi:helix-turn-helix domain-containing protein [Larkinella humicola]|uniref:AraC family transcriptional regulator n=1 Tax=Larkinella humicola TaxID=2607654 RepID=A0A5N1J2V8_9BACT|nr:helix-turn-helix domain-containing protein [Larkinella humicola]KAA9340357.1 AraC family transcriptional regulator [Larkinella humicola]
MSSVSPIEVQHYYPKNPLLQKHIEYYYFLKTDSPTFLSRYFAFPNTLQAFNIHKNATCRIDPFSTIVEGRQPTPYLMIAQGKHETPLYVELKGLLDKITILFKPLGLNHFLDRTLQEVTPADSQVVNNWFEHPHCLAFLDAFYQTHDYHQRIDMLETFLLSIYRPLADAPLLDRALDRLLDFDHPMSVESIIAESKLTTRSFNRLFLKHLTISPVRFRKIARFRHSLKDKMVSQQLNTLTQIGYRSNFYDQAYFIKVYRQLTGDRPSRFFNTIDKLADDRLIFKFLHDSNELSRKYNSVSDD